MSLKIFGVPVNVTTFNDRTSQIWKVNEKALNYLIPEIEWEYENEGEIVQLAQLVDLIRSNPKHGGSIRLYISYLPYARQDKNISNETTFALHSFAKLLNSLNIDSIKILDPHSEKALELIKNSKAIKPLHYINQTIEIVKPDILVFPDNGAYEKYKAHNFGIPKIFAEKSRNPLTGELSECRINGNVVGQNVLIIDDIVDGGGTFINLSRGLYDLGADEVNLYVTHGLFSKGLRPLKEAGILRIFTKNGEASDYDKNLVYTNWEDLKL